MQTMDTYMSAVAGEPANTCVLSLPVGIKRLVVMTDIHGCFAGLEEALRIEKSPGTFFVHGGDGVGYCSEIEATVVYDILADEAIPCVLGNNERIAMRMPFSFHGLQATFRNLPFRLVLQFPQFPKWNIYLQHSFYDDPEWRYLDESLENGWDPFASAEFRQNGGTLEHIIPHPANIVLIGHSHKQTMCVSRDGNMECTDVSERLMGSGQSYEAVLSFRDRYVVDCGSIGRPIRGLGLQGIGTYVVLELGTKPKIIFKSFKWEAVP